MYKISVSYAEFGDTDRGKILGRRRQLDSTGRQCPFGCTLSAWGYCWWK